MLLPFARSWAECRFVCLPPLLTLRCSSHLSSSQRSSCPCSSYSPLCPHSFQIGLTCTLEKMSTQPPSAPLSTQVPATIPPVTSSTTATRLPSLAEDKSRQKRSHGFVAGVFSGITKLVVGHPFGKSRLLFTLICHPAPDRVHRVLNVHPNWGT